MDIAERLSDDVLPGSQLAITQVCLRKDQQYTLPIAAGTKSSSEAVSAELEKLSQLPATIANFDQHKARHWVDLQFERGLYVESECVNERCSNNRSMGDRN